MTKPVIINRVTKGAALTYSELDQNFSNLQNATLSVTDGTNTHAFDLNDTITFTAGTNITLGVNPTTGAITINSTGGGTISSGHGGYIPVYSGSIGSTGTTIEESDIYVTETGITWTGTSPNENFQITLPNSTAKLTISGGGISTNGEIIASTLNTTGILKFTPKTPSYLASNSGLAGEVVMVYTGTSPSWTGAKLAYWDNPNNRWSYVDDNSAV